MHPSLDLAALTRRLRGHVEILARTPRAPDSPEHRQAALYIREQLRQAGYTVAEASFREAGFEGVNLLTAPLPDGEDLPLLILGAHYDSVASSPGADDNASAVAALLELAAWLPGCLATGPLACRIQLAAYDLEEYGLVGSFIHSRQVKQTGAVLVGMISLEMLGYTDARPGSQRLPPHLAQLYPTTGNFIGVVGNEASQGLLESVTAALRTVPDLPVESMAVAGNGEMLYETRLSDHSSFWDHGYPALMITDTSFFRNPHYHQASDTPETLDYVFLARVTAGVCQAAARLLDGQPGGSEPSSTP